MTRIDPRKRSSRRIGVPPVVMRLLALPTPQAIVSLNASSPFRARLRQTTLIQDPRTVSSFYSPVNAPGVNLLRFDSAPSFLGITNGPPFSSIGVHDPPTQRLAANGYASSELNPRGRQRGACLFLRCLWYDGAIQFNAIIPGNQGTNRSNRLYGVGIASSCSDTGTSSTSSLFPHIYTCAKLD